ncbi:hypothetical protein FA048_09455 [Pedobacter polaris]|uniref:Lipoprotein n=1 Tax=Pedobacter polaris TaxID=2571273 RepID=A0A4U1CSC5_9SPHI|nr:hypothetical protein [Pedobacter polaris]TKC10406.1 hypothetical protein FA048_09455 [Pedobacter polaris]
MKLSKIILPLTGIIFLATGCNFFKKEEEALDKFKLICYIAIDKGDTAWLSIDTSNRKMNGLLTMSYGGIKKFDGQVKGTINGDTLKGHFDFKLNKIDKWYRNPVAFLKKEEKLVMGVGETILVWGSGFHDEKVPIDYDRGRFIFEKTICK